MENFKESLTKALKISGKKFLIILIVISAIIIGLAALYYALVESFADKVADFFTNNKILYDIVEGAIEIKDEAIQNLSKLMENSGIEVENLKFKEEDLKKLCAAEIVSSEINRGEQEEEGKYYGRVYIKKLNEETGELEPLTYVPLEEFEKMGADEILDHFSMDEEKICFASVLNNGQTISIQKQEYKNLISQYVMPTEFLIDLCIITQNPNFVIALADKVLNETEIVLQVMQNKTTIVTTTTINYDIKTETTTTVREYDTEGKLVSKSGPSTSESTTKGEPDIKTETVININSNLKIVSVKNWLIDTSRIYNRVETTTPSTIPEVELENEEFYNDTDSDTYPNEDGSKTKITEKVVKTRINQKKLVQINTTTVSYQEGTSGEGVNDKVDELVEMLKARYAVPGSLQTEVILGKLEDGSEIFFNMLQEGTRTQGLEQLMRYILEKATGDDYGVSSYDFNIFHIRDFSSLGKGVSPFGTNLTREEFISLAEGFDTSSDYVEYMAKYAGDFYDVCEKYNINPCLAYAHACLETSYGSSSGCKNNKNYFGYAHYNNSSSGASYSTPRDSIEDYCQWVVNNSTPGTSAYNENLSRGMEYAEANSKLEGTPDANIYVLYCRYAYLGNTHISDEPDFSNPAGKAYYKENGSNWGTGGRIYLYAMYEEGGLYYGEYATRCGHANGSDETTTAERADYSVYTTNTRINIAKSIFGNGCFLGSAGSIVEAAYEVADYFLNSGVEVHYAGDSVPEATNNGRIVESGNIQASWDKPIQNPSRYGIVCATYVSFALWKAGLVDEETINRYNYHSCRSLESMLATSEYSTQWQKITNFSELQEGDIVFIDGHVYIFMDGGKCLDQNYCAVKSSGSREYLGVLTNASSKNFIAGYRYIGGRTINYLY